MVKIINPDITCLQTHSQDWPGHAIVLADSEPDALALSPAWPSAGNPAHDANSDMMEVPGSPLDTDPTRLSE